MTDPKIKYDIEAETIGKANVDALATSLDGLADTLDGDVKAGALAAAAALRELSDRNQAAQSFAALKREVTDVSQALDLATRSVEEYGAQLPAAAAATERFSESERRVRTEVVEAQASLKTMRQALVDLRAGNEGAARGTDEYRASVAQARSSIAELRTTISQKKTELKAAEAGTRSAALAEKELETSYQQSVTSAKSLSAAYGEKNRALDAARIAAQQMGVDTAKLRQEELALAQGMDQARAKVLELSKQQEAASASARAQAEALNATKAAADTAATAASAAGQRIQTAFSTLGVRSAADLRAEIAQVKAALQTVEVESGLTGNALKTALSGGNDRLKELQRELRGVQGELTLTDKASGLLRTGLAQIAGGNLIANAIGLIGTKAAEMGRDFLAANLQLEGMRRGLNAVYKDANVTAAQIDFLRKTANDAGVSAGGLADSFKSFAASTHAANIPLEVTNSLFASVTQAGASLGLSGERVSLVLQALGQMAAKGTVSMEELRQQLGESLPGAMSLAAQGLGLTEAQLIKLVESGKLAARDLFPALSKSLQQLKGETDGVTTTWERFKNSLTLASQNVGDAGFMQVLTLALKALGVVVAAVVLPLTAFAEVIFGVAKAAGVLVGAIATLSNPLEALGKIVDDASARQRALSDAFGILVNGADAAAQAQGRVGVAATQAGASAAASATGVQQSALAHTAAGTAAQSNSAAQSALAITTKIAGDASLEASSKWVQLGVRLGEVAAAQERQANNSVKLAAAAKIEGDSLVALAQLRGNDLESLNAAAQAADGNAEALQRVTDAREAQLATLQAELEAKKALIAGNAEEQKARALELEEIQKKIDAMTAEAATTRAAAQAAKNDAAERRAAVASYKDNSLAVVELRLAMEQAQIVEQAYENARRKGIATDQQVEDARRRAAVAQRIYNDALNDAVAAEQRKGAATQATMQLERAGLDVAMALARAAEQKAIAEGRDYAASQARIKQKEIEISLLKLTVAAAIAEADAMDLVTTKKIEAAIAEGKWNEALAAEMQLLRQSAELKRQQAAATAAGVAELERQLRVLRGYEKAVGDVSRSSVRDTDLMTKGWQAVGNAAQGAGAAATAAAQANQKALQKIYDRHRLSQELTPDGERKDPLQEILERNVVGDGSDLVGKSGDVREAAVLETDINQDIVKRYGADMLNDPNTRKAWELRGQLANYRKNYGNVARSQQSLDQERNIRNELERVEGEIEKARVKAERERAQSMPTGSPTGGSSSSGSGTGGRTPSGGTGSGGTRQPSQQGGITRVVNISIPVGDRMQSFPIPTTGIGEASAHDLAKAVVNVLAGEQRRLGR